MAPPCAVTVSDVTGPMAFILVILMSVPPRQVPQGEVEWFEPTARTGDGYLTGSFRTATISATDPASTITAGCDVMFPNQFVTVFDMISVFYTALGSKRVRF